MRFYVVPLGAGFAVMDTERGHFVADSSYSIFDMADCKASMLNDAESERLQEAYSDNSLEPVVDALMARSFADVMADVFR